MHVGPVIAVTDLDRARAFYEGKLGLAGTRTPGGWMLRADEGTVIYLLPDVPDAGSASWPLASFLVGDLRQKVRDLRVRDVPFLAQEELPFELDQDALLIQPDTRV
jgi:catechol 2,3-dioxygenase-like lactoylglutathione lyase family enzyme